MNARNTVWVERDLAGKVIRIFRSTHGEDWRQAMLAERLFTCPKKDAVGEIRSQIWQRCGGRCEWCGKRITENGPLWQRMHMHEQAPKGKAIGGGLVSLENSVGICQNCHENDPRGHQDRHPQWSKPFDLEEE